jgi:putative FmdB family regulatory protein
MPLYDYKCDICGHVHEAYSSIAERDRDDVECPLCGTAGCRREVSAAAVTSDSSSMSSSMPFSPVPT